MLPVVLNVRWTGRWSLRLISQCIVTVTAQEGQLQWYLSAPHPTLGCMRQCCASVGERYFDQRASVPVRVSLGQCHNGCEWPCMIVTQSLTHCVQVYAGRVGGTVYNTRTGAQVLRYQHCSGTILNASVFHVCGRYLGQRGSVQCSTMW
jgi:hypothetical protein